MKRWLLKLLGGPQLEPQDPTPATETALPPVVELPRQCPECHSPHACKMHDVIHSFPSGRVIEKPPGVVFCAICGTVYVATDAGIERRKQRQPDQPPPQGQHGERVDHVAKAMESLRWRRPKV